MTEQEENNIRTQLFSSPESILAAGSFTFDGHKDSWINFELDRHGGDSLDQDAVVITISYPFDRETYEDVYESLRMPRTEFDRIIRAIVRGDSQVSYSDSRGRFELHREKSGRINFKFSSEGYKLDLPCLIDGLLV